MLSTILDATRCRPPSVVPLLVLSTPAGGAPGSTPAAAGGGRGGAVVAGFGFVDFASTAATSTFLSAGIFVNSASLAARPVGAESSAAFAAAVVSPAALAPPLSAIARLSECGFAADPNIRRSDEQTPHAYATIGNFFARMSGPSALVGKPFVDFDVVNLADGSEGKLSDYVGKGKPARNVHHCILFIMSERSRRNMGSFHTSSASRQVVIDFYTSW